MVHKEPGDSWGNTVEWILGCCCIATRQVKEVYMGSHPNRERLKIKFRIMATSLIPIDKLHFSTQSHLEVAFLSSPLTDALCFKLV